MDEREDLRRRILASFEDGKVGVKLHTLPPDYLERFRKNTQSYQALPIYSISFVTSGNLPFRLDRFCCDASHCIILRARLGFLSGDVAIAVLSFYRDPSNNGEIVIKQIQGAGLEKSQPHRLLEWWWRRGTIQALTVLRWEKVLLTFVTDFAFEIGFDKARVTFAENTPYYQRPCDTRSSIAEVQKRLRLRYNVTPARLGFKKEQDGHVMTRERWQKQKRKKIQAS